MSTPSVVPPLSVTVPQKSVFGHDFGMKKDASKGLKEKWFVCTYAHAHGHRAHAELHAGQTWQFQHQHYCSAVVLASVTFDGTELVEI